MQRRPDVVLEIASLALQRVRSFLAQRTLQDYLNDEMCRSAIERQLEIAGDSLGQLRKLDPDMFAKIPDGDIVVAFRNVLAHGYVTLDHRKVYEIASARAAELLATLDTLLAQFPDDSEVSQ
jgi:uncharacterized protein with HEPN domain